MSLERNYARGLAPVLVRKLLHQHIRAQFFEMVNHRDRDISIRVCKKGTLLYNRNTRTQQFV